jgi:hypothetical protein
MPYFSRSLASTASGSLSFGTMRVGGNTALEAYGPNDPKKGPFLRLCSFLYLYLCNAFCHWLYWHLRKHREKRGIQYLWRNEYTIWKEGQILVARVIGMEEALYAR